ncbi:MAG TPA: hypothetical protein VJC04_01635 [Candidatus Paceibacterota bacterium]
MNLNLLNADIIDILKVKYSLLPLDVRLAIKSEKNSAIIQKIATDFQLRADQDQDVDLENETVLVLLGLEPPADFINNLQKALSVPLDKARAIGQKVNELIFQPIKESLRKIHGLETQNSSPKPILSPTITPIQTPPKPELASIVPTPPVVGTSTKELPPPKTEQPRAGKPEDETKLNREEILAGIENPVRTKPTPLISANIVQDKLSGMVRMPKEETDLSKEYSADPYREPI